MADVNTADVYTATAWEYFAVGRRNKVKGNTEFQSDSQARTLLIINCVLFLVL